MKLQQWAHWAEIIASFAVVVTLVFLVQEVRGNTLALDRQANLDRVRTITTPFFEAPELASVLSKIKAVDGADPLPQALAERYELSPDEAILWERQLYMTWLWLEADFLYRGGSQEVEGWVRSLMRTPDNQLYWSTRRANHAGSFRTYVDAYVGG